MLRNNFHLFLKLWFQWKSKKDGKCFWKKFIHFENTKTIFVKTFRSLVLSIGIWNLHRLSKIH